MSDILDKNGKILLTGDTVRCTLLEFEIEYFQNTLSGYLACGDYGCIAVNLLEKIKSWNDKSCGGCGSGCGTCK
jgi:hypothetical protein